jgi:hypothetical protein
MIVAISLLCCLAAAHSVAGEALILRPALADRRWKARVSRPDADGILRWTWHAGSLAWLAFAAIVAGARPEAAVGIACLLLGLAMLALVPGHPAWPAFLAAGLYALDSAEALPRSALSGIALLGVAIAGLGSLLHLAWALGTDALRAHTFPENPQTLEPLAEPGRLACLAVAGAAAVFAGLISWVAFSTAPAWAWWLAAGALAVAAIRSIGDFRDIGFFKSVRRTPFGRLDTRLYTPLFVGMAASAWAALVLAGVPG